LNSSIGRTRPGAGANDEESQTKNADQTVSLGLRLLNFGPLLILIALVFSVSLLTPNFLKPGNLSNILSQTAVIAIVAMGQHLVILTRGIDLSVGANLALATVVGGLVFKNTDSSILVMGAMLFSAVAVGLINGVGFVYGRLPHAFIMTLATLSICRGLALELSINHTTMRGMPEAIASIGSGETFGLPNSFFVVVGVAILLLVMAKGMVWGRWIYAVGGKPEAAVQMGVPVKGVLVSTYALSGLCVGVGAIVLSGRTQASSPLYGNLLELDTIAAVIIGGASFLGGRGNIGNALIGAVLIGVVRNSLNLLNVGVFYQMIAIGVVILLAVEGDVLRGRLEARTRVLQARGSRS
jgi:ribose transport system permease protein